MSTPPKPDPAVAGILRSEAPYYDAWAKQKEDEAEELRASGNNQAAAICRGLALMHRHHATAARAGRTM